MKRKRLDRDLWTSIQSKRYIQKNVSRSDFQGIVSLLYLQTVEPASIWDTTYGKMAVSVSGMKWLQFLPKDGHYLLTAMISAENTITGFYIDAIAGYGIDDDGVAFVDDLYLDFVLYTNGNILIDDRDELIEAYQTNKITQAQYDLAEQTQEALLKGILKDVSALNRFCLEYLSYMENAVAG